MFAPIQELLLISLALSLVMAVIYRLLINPDDMRKVKKDMAFYREKVNAAQKAGNKEESSRYSKEMLKASQSQMKHTMKPMMATMVIFFVALGWMAAAYAEFVVASPFPIPFIGASLNWFWWYMIIVIPGNLIFRKMLGVE